MNAYIPRLVCTVQYECVDKCKLCKITFNFILEVHL